jgi:polysaccharide export outer membrane protein/exopolysaccharide production protein ExoF
MSTLRRARADLPMQPALCCMDRRDFSALRFARFLMLIISAFFVVGTAAASAEPYTLGPQDKLRLRVFEWRAPVDQVYEWTALNGDFIVSSSGTVSLPLLGEISAAGLSPNEFAEAISKQMADEMKLRWPPKVAVEVAEYRPFFIVGAVAKPGAYPYQPGLTILRALSIGGGLPRLGEAGLLRHGREVIAGRGSVTQLALKTNELQARKARLEAELKRAEMITFPEELEKARSNPDFARVLEQEESIFKARRTAVDTQVSTLNQLKTYLVSEIDALAQQVELKKGEHATVKQELGNVTTLVEKGLSVSGRQFSLERLSAQLSSDQLQLETALLKAKQEISRTEVAIDETINNRAIEVASLLRATEAELEDTLVKYKTEEKLLYDSEIVYPRLMTSRRQDSARNEPKYSIVRVIDGASQQIAAEETTDVMPGDTIKIELPMLDDLSSILKPPPQATQ